MANHIAESLGSPPHSTARSWGLGGIALVLVPLLLLTGVLAIILATDAGLGDRTAPPIETLSIQRPRLPEPGIIELSVTNEGPDAIAIVQVVVDDAYWQ